MIDPDTGNEVQPEEEAYGDVLVTALRDYLDPELYKLKTIPYVAGKRSGRESEHYLLDKVVRAQRAHTLLVVMGSRNRT